MDDQLLADFNTDLSLWRRTGGGHTRSTKDCKEVHEARFSAGRLLTLAEYGKLDCVDAPAVLKRLIMMQDRSEGPQHGCLRWYWEDSKIEDTNAAFFVCLPLLSMQLRFADRLDVDTLEPLEDLLRELRVWFHRAVGERAMHYPNKYLGDLVCAWLLREIFGEDEETPELLNAMLEAAGYWQREHWGWGEHMSDIYSRVILDELSTLLLLQCQLPEQHQQAYRQLLGEILAIDDQFGDGPRVPAIRSYAFDGCPPRVPYRRRRTGCGPRTYAGWDELAPAQQPVAADIRVPCFGGAEAVARIHADCRLGSLTHYQFMDGVDHMEWGLCWQTFPVAFWRPAGDWGFLQYLTRQDDRVRAHPATGRKDAYHDNALSTDRRPPIIGETRCVQKGDRLHAARRLPAISPLWDCAVDRFNLLGLDPAAVILEQPDGVDIRYPERTVRIRVHPHSGGQVRLEHANGSLVLSVEWERSVLAGLSEVRAEWNIEL